MSEVASALVKMSAKLDAPPAPAPVPQVDEPAPATVAVPHRRPARMLWLSGVMAVLAVALAGVWWQMHRRPSQPRPSAAPLVSANAPSAPPPPPSAASDQIAAAAPPPPSSPLPAIGQRSEPAAPAPLVVAPKEKLTPTSPAPNPAAAAIVTAPTASAPRAATPQDLVSVTLNDGLPFRIALIEDVPLDAEAGRTVHFRVIDAVQGGPVTAIPQGAIVTGSIAALGGKRNFFGERSKAKFRLLAAAGADANMIRVRATPQAANNRQSERPFATANKSERDLKAKNLIAASGTEYVAYIAGDQTVNVRR